MGCRAARLKVGRQARPWGVYPATGTHQPFSRRSSLGAALVELANGSRFYISEASGKTFPGFFACYADPVCADPLRSPNLVSLFLLQILPASGSLTSKLFKALGCESRRTAPAGPRLTPIPRLSDLRREKGTPFGQVKRDFPAKGKAGLRTDTA